MTTDDQPYDRTATAYSDDGSHLQVDAIYWQEIMQRDRAALCNLTFFDRTESDALQFRFLNEEVRIDFSTRTLLRSSGGMWHRSEDPLLTLATVMYLKNVQAVYPLGKDIVGVRDLKEGHFFAGPHELRTEPLLQRYGNDPGGFCRAGSALAGRPMDMADAAFQLLPFPRVPLYFLLWAGDTEFDPRLQVLFDRSIEQYLAADTIWALVNRVAIAFLRVEPD